MRRLLFPFSLVYGVAVWLRNRAFDLKILPATRIGVPVVSVGNLTAGGTGKTPLVAWIAEALLKKGRAVAIISRGYGRESSGVVVVSDGSRIQCGAREGGDEPVELAWALPGVRVVVGERRVEAAHCAVGKLKADVLVLDDGFQHRYLERDLDILVLDARKDLRSEPLLPAGNRREQLAEVCRADLVGFSRARPGHTAMPPARYKGRAFRYRTRTVAVVRAPGEATAPLDSLRGRSVYAFSGIGDHNQFAEGLRESGLAVCGEERFADHHPYTDADLEKIARNADASGAEVLLTTRKDLTRLSEVGAPYDELCRTHKVFSTRIAVEILEGEETLRSLLDETLQRK